MSPRHAPRLLFVPYERQIGTQSGPRDAFESMEADGTLSAYTAFSVVHAAQAVPADRAWSQLAERAADFRPDLTIVSRVGNLPTTASDVAAVRRTTEPGLLVYEDLDPYGRLHTRMPASGRLLASAADVVCISGLGPFARQFRRAGAKQLRFMAHGFDATRFGRIDVSSDPRPFDVVIIANRAASRIPGVRMPGVRQRERLVRILAGRHGDRLAIYGSGWDDLAGARGPIPFDEQERANGEGRVTASWDNFPDITFYSSNRVPIALAGGSIHVTDYRRGYEVMFAGCRGLFWRSTPEDVADAVDALLAKSPEELADMRRATQRYARAHLSQQAQYRALVEDLVRRMSSP